MKLTVVYDSKTGNTKQAAEWIAEGMGSVAGVEARAFSISSVDPEFGKESAGIVVGCMRHPLYSLRTCWSE